MRRFFIFALILALAIPLLAQQNDRLEDLKSKAEHKSEADRGPAYADVVEELVKRAEQHFKAAQSAEGQDDVKQAVEYAEKAAASTKIKGKHIKKTEIKLRHSQYDLDQMRRSAVLQDQQVLESAVKRIQELRDELLRRMFRKE
jgi:hypothetical protein